MKGSTAQFRLRRHPRQHALLLALLLPALAPGHGQAAAAAAAATTATTAAMEEHAGMSPEMAPAMPGPRRTTMQVSLGEVPLVREDGVKVKLADLLHGPRPVYVDFIFTTCTGVCPMLSANFAALQRRLDAAHAQADLISISTDPEQDTPARLRAYRQKYGGGERWHFYTGTAQADAAALRAFGVYTGDKMLHAPVTVFRADPAAPWIRLDGFASADDLYRELSPAKTAGR